MLKVASIKIVRPILDATRDPTRVRHASQISVAGSARARSVSRDAPFKLYLSLKLHSFGPRRGLCGLGILG